MMTRFGSWSEYRNAPRTIVEEQIEEWRARNKAEYDANNDPPAQT